MIRVFYFAALVDALGTAYEEFELPSQAKTVADVVNLLRQRGEAWEKAFGSGLMRITVNRRFVDLNAPVSHGDEIAFVSVRV